MSRPLVATVQHELDSDTFHNAVFKEHGRGCYFHRSKWWKKKRKIDGKGTSHLVDREPHERCQKDATDAMHIVPRSQLGPKSRFACPEENGRPGCRPCHDLQELGLIEFDDTTHNKAIRALQKVTPKIGLRER